MPSRREGKRDGYNDRLRFTGFGNGLEPGYVISYLVICRDVLGSRLRLRVGDVMGSLAVQDLVGAGFSVDTAGGEGVHAHDSVITTFAHSHCQHVFPRGDRVLGAEVTSYIGGRFFGIDGLFTDGTSVNVRFLRIDTIRGIWPSPPGTREPKEALGF